MISLKDGNIKEILYKLKDSVANPTIAVYFTGNEEIIDNIKCLEPNECKLLLDCITKLQKDLDYQKEAEQEYNEKHTKLMKKHKKLQEENKKDREYIKELRYNLRFCHIKNNKLIIENARLKDCESRINKANECIKENTRWFDSEYAKVYGELCDCEGYNANRLEVLVNPSNLSKILGGDDND